uniref:Helicase C-terminal domain-containing protein n=1 Tax=Brassica oleracea TaxID=3712 RepID=A0A3P6BNZ0_BRAOL|nr:unnamed protein product [Brassica oleracea]
MVPGRCSSPLFPMAYLCRIGSVTKLFVAASSSPLFGSCGSTKLVSSLGGSLCISVTVCLWRQWRCAITLAAVDHFKSVDRAYRIGQTKDVIVYRCTREACLKTVTEHKEQIRYFSQQDLRELFSLPKEGFDVSPTQQQLYEEHYNQIKLDEFLESHVKFLETLGISGVSHHSLLFSKTAPIQQNEVEEIRRRRGKTSYLGGPSASSSQDNMNNGAEYAFKPKDVKLDKRIINISPIDEYDLSEREIKARVSRLSMLFQNKVRHESTLVNNIMVASLPDRGAKKQKQIAELTRELEEIKAAQSSDMSHQVIDISQKMHIILQS